VKDLSAELRRTVRSLRYPEPAIAVIGDLNYDIIVISAPLEAGRRLATREVHRCLGGAAGVAACGLARLGASVRLIGCVGGDRDGYELKAELQRRGVDCSGLERTVGSAGDDVGGTPFGDGGVMDLGVTQTARTGHTGAENPFTLIFTQPGERVPRQVATFRGVLESFSLRGREPERLIRGCAAVYACNYFIMPALRGDIGVLFAAARRAGLLTAYDANAGDGWTDPAQLRTLVEAVYPHTDVVFLNEEEAAHLSGHRDARRSIGRLCPAAGTLVIKRGAAGALVRRDGEAWEVGAFAPGEAVKDTVGAGDSFQACFLYFLLTGVPAERCALLAAAAASATLRHHGGTEGQLDRSGLESYLERYRVLDCGDGRLVVQPT
jgi:sugar/nucleoside kinase (ribokinase family)